MHAFETYLGEDFFERFKTSIIEANIRKDIVIDDRFSFHVICSNNKQIDFTFLANPSLIVIGFPFRVKEKAHRIVQYRQYIKFHNSPMDENYWIEQMTRRIRGYMGGHYHNLEKLKL